MCQYQYRCTCFQYETFAFLFVTDAPFGQTGATDTANNSLHEVNDDSYDDDDDSARGRRDANASESSNNPTVSGADNRTVYALMQELDQER